MRPFLLGHERLVIEERHFEISVCRPASVNLCQQKVIHVDHRLAVNRLSTDEKGVTATSNFDCFIDAGDSVGLSLVNSVWPAGDNDVVSILERGR